jgi:hypothetical protein
MIVSSAKPVVRPALANTPGRVVHLPSGIRRPANRLLDQQFWLWGCDVRREEGNLLVQLGFDKIKAPQASGLRTSQYACRLSIDSTISLWGFGLCLRHDPRGAIFIPRAGFRPSYAAEVTGLQDAWEPAWFDRMHEPASAADMAAFCQLTLAALEWIGWYERRILEMAGVEYRQRTVAAWSRPVCRSDAVGPCWQTLLIQVHRYYANHVPLATQ